MAEIESSLGKKTFSGNPKKVYTVEDGTNTPFPQAQVVTENNLSPTSSQEDYDKVRKEKIDQLRTSHNISFNAKQRIEILTGIGRNTREFTFENVKFSLKTLKSRELKQILLDVSKLEGIPFTFELRANTLACSLYLIDDHNVEDVIGSSSIEDKINFINDLEENIVEAIYKEYIFLVEETEKKYILNKNSTEEDVTEVIDTIKK